MMDSTKLTFTEQVSPTVPLKQIDKLNPDEVSEEKKKQIAKDFESLLINNLLDEMKNTIGSWGFEKGGFGFWKDIYQTMTKSGHQNPAENSIDRQL